MPGAFAATGLSAVSLQDWLTLTLICSAGAMSPGPSLALVLGNSWRDGRAAGYVTALSHAAGVGAYALLVALGLATVLTSRPQLLQVLQFAGAGYLIWLGIGALGLLRPPSTQ